MKITMKTCRLAITVLMLTGSLVTSASAQDISPELMKASKAALAASGATDQFDGILPNISAKVKSDIISSRPDLADVVSMIVDEETLKLAMRRGDLEKESATIYGGAFSVEELDKIAVFYKSSAGQKLLKEAPVLIREMNKASKIWAAGIARDLNAAVDKRLKEKGIE